MKNRFLEYLVLFLIIVFSSFLYFYKIYDIPNGVYSDEATVGYNAFSILQTGRDEFGKAFPIAFRFFGAYTPPLYVYLIIPFIKVFGLNEFSIRALSGISTLLGVVVIFLLTKSFWIYKSKLAPLLSALIFAVSPWVIFNARLGYEVTLGYVMFSLGAYRIWKGIRDRYLSTFGLLVLSLSTYVAHTERFLVPLFLLAVAIIFYAELRSFVDKKSVYYAAIILLFTQIPNFYLLTTKAFWVKNSVYSGISISQAFIDFTSQYLLYLSPSELFGISRDINLQHTIPLSPLFFSWLIIPFFIGLNSLYQGRKTLDGKYLIVLLLISPLPGALSGHFISIQRVLPLIIPVIMIITLGIDFLLSKVRHLVLFPLFIFLTLFSSLLLWRSYFVLFPKERAVSWSYGYRQFTDITSANPDLTYVLDNARMSPVYMSILYHLQYPPSQFQKQFGPDYVKSYYTNPPYNSQYVIGNIDVRPVIWETDTVKKQVIVGDILSISEDQAKEHFLDKIFDIKDPFGNSILIGYKTNPDKKVIDNDRKKAAPAILANPR